MVVSDCLVFSFVDLTEPCSLELCWCDGIHTLRSAWIFESTRTDVPKYTIHLLGQYVIDSMMVQSDDQTAGWAFLIGSVLQWYEAVNPVAASMAS